MAGHGSECDGCVAILWRTRCGGAKLVFREVGMLGRQTVLMTLLGIQADHLIGGDCEVLF